MSEKSIPYIPPITVKMSVFAKLRKLRLTVLAILYTKKYSKNPSTVLHTFCQLTRALKYYSVSSNCTLSTGFLLLITLLLIFYTDTLLDTFQLFQHLSPDQIS